MENWSFLPIFSETLASIVLSFKIDTAFRKPDNVTLDWDHGHNKYHEILRILKRGYFLEKPKYFLN